MQRTRGKLTLAILLVILVTAAAALSGCSNGDGGEEATEFKVGSQGYAEVETLGELVRILIEENTNHTVTHVKDLGSAMAGHQATLSGDLDMNTSFTGTLFLGLFEQEITDDYRNPDAVYQYVYEHLLDEYDLYAVPPYGYNNTYAIAVPRVWAEENNVTAISDLAPFAADMIVGMDQTWKDYPGQGYEEFQELYGFSFKETPEMDFGLMYRSIDAGELDAVIAYSTDGQLVAQDLLVLEDDLGFNPPYNGILVVRNEVVEEYPEVKELLLKLEGLIDTEQMQAINKRVAVDEVEPEEAAREFLLEQELITE